MQFHIQITGIYIFLNTLIGIGLVIVSNSKGSFAFAPTKIYGSNFNHYARQGYPFPSLKSQVKLPSSFPRNLDIAAQEKSTSTKFPNSLGNKMLSKIGSSTSTVVAGTFFVVLAYQRNSFMLTFFIGSIINGITSKILKKILNQDRPSGYENDPSIKVKPSDKGMPSSHAMSLGFIGIYTAIALCNGILVEADIGVKIAICTGLFGYVVLSLIYRVLSQLHTTNQVIVGLVTGSKFFYPFSVVWHFRANLHIFLLIILFFLSFFSMQWINLVQFSSWDQSFISIFEYNGYNIVNFASRKWDYAYSIFDCSSACWRSCCRFSGKKN